MSDINTDLYAFAIDEFVNAFHSKGKRVFKEAFYDTDANFWKHVLIAMGIKQHDIDMFVTFKDFSLNTLYGIMQDKLKKKKSVMGPGRPRPIYKLWMTSKGEPKLLLGLGKVFKQKDDKNKLCTILQKLWDLKYEDGLIGRPLLKKCKKFMKSFAHINLVGSLQKHLYSFCEYQEDLDTSEQQPKQAQNASEEKPAQIEKTGDQMDDTQQKLALPHDEQRETELIL